MPDKPRGTLLAEGSGALIACGISVVTIVRMLSEVAEAGVQAESQASGDSVARHCLGNTDDFTGSGRADGHCPGEFTHTQGETADLEFIASARESGVGAAVRIVGFT